MKSRFYERIFVMKKKSVVIVEDDRGLREQLIQILESAPDIKCLGAFISAEEALAADSGQESRMWC